jgi:uncharacterized membrane protein
MQTSNKSSSQARTLLVLLGMLIASVLVTAVFAYAALEWMPYRWFGSGFEGGCGYGAVMATLAASVILCPVLFIGSALLYFKRGKGAQAMSELRVARGEMATPASGLVTQWRLAFAVAMVVNLLPLVLMFSGTDLPSELSIAFNWLGMLMLLVNGFMAYKVAVLVGQMPIVMAVASVVVGWMGAAGVFIYLHTLVGRAPKAGPST